MRGDETEQVVFLPPVQEEIEAFGFKDYPRWSVRSRIAQPLETSDLVTTGELWTEESFSEGCEVRNTEFFDAFVRFQLGRFLRLV